MLRSQVDILLFCSVIVFNLCQNWYFSTQCNHCVDAGFSKQASVELGEIKLGLMSNLANEEYFV